MDPNKNMIGNLTGFKMTQGNLQAYAKYFYEICTGIPRQRDKDLDDHAAERNSMDPLLAIVYVASRGPGHFHHPVSRSAVRKDSLDTRIYLGTVNYPNPDYIRTFMRQKTLKNTSREWACNGPVCGLCLTPIRNIPASLHADREYVRQFRKTTGRRSKGPGMP